MSETDRFEMYIENNEIISSGVQQMTEDTVELIDEDMLRIRELADFLRDLFDMQVTRPPNNNDFTNEIIDVFKGKVDFMTIAKKFINEYVEGGG